MSCKPTEMMTSKTMSGASCGQGLLRTELVADALISSSEDVRRRQQVKEMKEDLRKLSMVDEFAQYARLERRINTLADDIKSTSKKKQDMLWKVTIAANIVYYVSQVLIFGSILIRYRSEPVLLLPEEWVYPCSYIIAFPSGIPGAVGITVWILICRNVVPKVSGLVHRLVS